jgi:hypothetical protein
MADISWNPWKLTTIGLALVGATALVTGLVVANRGNDRAAVQQPAPATAPAADALAPVAPIPTGAGPAAAPGRAAVKAAPAPIAQRTAAAVPPQATVETCNEIAHRSTKDKTIEVVKDGAIGAVLGAAVGAAGGAIADGGKGAGKGAAIGGVLGAGGGSLYGINNNRQHDDQYRAAYAQCMRSHGYNS